MTLATLLDNIQWVSFLALTVTPTLAAIGLFTTPVQTKTFVWSVVYYFMTGLGITAGESSRHWLRERRKRSDESRSEETRWRADLHLLLFFPFPLS